MGNRDKVVKRSVLTLCALCILTLLVGGCSTPTLPGQDKPTPRPSPTTLAIPQATELANPPPARTTPEMNLGTSTPSATAVPSDVLVFALLTDNRLLAVRAQAGVVATELRLAPAEDTSTIESTGHYMALGDNGSTLYVLASAAARVAVIDVATTRMRATYSLPKNGVYRSLAVGRRTGRLYLYGNDAKDVRVLVLDPDSGARLETWRLVRPGGYNWWVYQGEVSPDERELYISYHGADTTGIDRFRIVGGRLERCEAAAAPGAGCISAHGGFTLHESHLLVATGDRIVLKMDADGKERGAVDTGLDGNHLMEFVVDQQRGRLYAVGSCAYSGGFSATDLRGAGVPTTPTIPGEWRWLSTPEPPRVKIRGHEPCGERLALSSDSVLVVGRTAKPVPGTGPGELQFVDVRTGRVTRSVGTSSEPVDVLVAAP